MTLQDVSEQTSITVSNELANELVVELMEAQTWQVLGSDKKTIHAAYEMEILINGKPAVSSTINLVGDGFGIGELSLIMSAMYMNVPETEHFVFGLKRDQTGEWRTTGPIFVGALEREVQDAAVGRLLTLAGSR